MKKVKIIAALLIVLLFLIIHIAAPGFIPEVAELLSHGDIVETAEYIRGYGSMAVVFAFLLTLFVNALGFPPAIIFSTANTLIFGIFWGIVISVVAETVGVTISFLLLRFFFREQAEKIISKSKFLSRMDQYSGEKGFIVMLIARMVPYIPSALLNAVGALSSLSLRDYFISSLIGKFPSTGIEAIIGHDTILQEEDPTRIIVVVIFAVLLIGWAWCYEKNYTKKELNTSAWNTGNINNEIIPDVELEQAKKRNHKVMITNTAIKKVPFVKVSSLSDNICEELQKEHKKILEIAQEQNFSNEVLTIGLINMTRKTRILGDEFSANPSNSPEAHSIFATADKNEIMFLHNHQSTNKFSLADIITFVRYAQIGLMSVVTNQGEVYILHKNLKYNYQKAKNILNVVYQKYATKEIEHNEAVNMFLKVCSEGGIEYVRSK